MATHYDKMFHKNETIKVYMLIPSVFCHWNVLGSDNVL